MPPALNLPWTQIRGEYVAGVPLVDLAKKYGVAKGTLFARSGREKWAELRPETHALRASSAALVVQKGTAEVVGQTLAQRGQAYASRVFDKVSKLVDAAALQPPKNYRDLELADKVARRAAGLDVTETQVNALVGIGVLGHGPAGGDPFFDGNPPE